ncbi:MAG TPA: sugar phosphate isomerase/epimerase [Planctomycetes bacterium]|nr:sugar phosphate isomerase/epimerase [Fuerstiella sp.]HIK92701.1 sugar phosphate isomerase/epimerase [Planctomycetota bacterium]
MIQIHRRFVLKQAVAVGVASVVSTASATSSNSIAGKRKFTMDLTGGAIGVRAGQVDTINLANKFGFESVAPDAGYLASLDNSGRGELAALMKDKGVVWGAAGLPVEFRKDEDTFRSGLQRLPALAKAMELAGVTRVGTWLKPYHPDLTYVANFRQHARRLRECVKVLGDHGQRFGMEYVGPKTLWASERHSFIHTMAETKDLIAEIGQDNVGFILDSWHWYTAHETVDDLRTLSNKDVVACDLNDAPAGFGIDQQIDNQRKLPSATGVIDMKSFLGVLVEIGYDGPIRSEPFNAKLNAMENDEACAATAAAMKKAFALVGG